MFEASSTWTAIAFWIGLAAIICTWIITAAGKRKRAMGTIQSAIERGQPLDGQTVRLLLGGHTRIEQRRDLQLQACVWLALGAGFVVWALVGFPTVHTVIMGLGAVLASVGVGLFAAARFAFAATSENDEQT